ncbi:MAG: hypothetical protein ACI9GM_000608 [Salibacteraceae bacterium]|jgi:hypothetical protein
MKKLFMIVPIVLLLIFTQSCKDDEEELIPPTVLAIGDFHQGGVIFYLDATKTHGLVCSTGNQSYGCEWGCQPSVITGANGLEVGTGAQNTVDIRSVCSSNLIAAAICDSLVSNGYDDWFLPSKDELNLIHQNRDVINLISEANNGERIQNIEYWTSSHQLSNTVWVQYMGQGGSQIGDGEDESNHVRAVRAF